MAEKPTYQELEHRIEELEKKVSGLKKTGSKLQENQAYLRALIRTIPDLVWFKDPVGRYLFCNYRFEGLYGVKEEEIIGKSDYDFVDRELADFFREHDRLAVAKGAPNKNEEEVIFAVDGHRELLETIKTPVYDKNGNLIGVLGIGHDISELRQAETERLANLSFFENLDKVNRAINSTRDLEEMMRVVLDTLLAIFDCDRAYLLYPCDPDAHLWEVPMECTRSEYPGAYELGKPLTMLPALQRMNRALLNTDGPIQFIAGKEIDPAEEPWKQFKIKSVLAIALYPKIGGPWHFGLHQCSYPRNWTLQEQALFQEISRRLTDGLSSLLVYQDLHKSEESYRTVLNTAPYSIVITRLSDSAILQVNEAFTQRIGYTMEEVAGRSALEMNIYADPSDRKHLMDKFRRAGHVTNEQIVFNTKYNRLIENMISISPIRFRGEDCIISMTVDIHELKMTQRALEESEARFRTIFETAADPIFLNSLETGAFIDVNYAACNHLGYDKEEIMKMSLADINDAGAFDPIAHFKKRRMKDESSFFESTHIRKDGSKAIVEGSSRTLRHQDRVILLSIIRDITLRKQTEAELARYRKNLEKMVNERTAELKAAQNELVKKEKMAVLGQLTATVSHELRNPLGVIRSSNFFLQRRFKDQDAKTDKHFKRIDEQISLCDAIVNDLLEYTRGRDIKLSEKNLSPWLLEVIEQLQEQENIKIDVQLDPALPAVLHDEEKMRRVILNLLINASQAVKAKAGAVDGESRGFTPQIRIDIYREHQGILIRVSDNGIGMDDQTKHHAFEPLFTTRSRGTGLGLAIIKKIVEDHGGDLNLESQPGEGTRVEFRLPLGSHGRSVNHDNSLK